MENQDVLISIVAESVKILLERLEYVFQNIKEKKLVYNISWRNSTTLSISTHQKTVISDLIDNILLKEHLWSYSEDFWNQNLTLEQKLRIILSIIDALISTSKNYTLYYMTYVDLPFSFLNGFKLGNQVKKIKIKLYTCDKKNNVKLNNKRSKLNFNENVYNLNNKVSKITLIYSESYLIDIDKQNEINEMIDNSTIIKITNSNINNRIISSKKDLKLIWQKINNNLDKLRINDLDHLKFNIFMASSPQSTFYIGKKIAEKYNRYKNIFFRIFFYDFQNKKYTNYLEIAPNNKINIVKIINKKF